MKWDEFSSLLSGLSEDTPLGKIVLIRAETDKNIVKNMTTSQKRIRSEWYARERKNISVDDSNKAMENFKQTLINMSK